MWYQVYFNTIWLKLIKDQKRPFIYSLPDISRNKETILIAVRVGGDNVHSRMIKRKYA